MSTQQTATTYPSYTTTTSQQRYSHYSWVVITFTATFLVYKYILQVSPSVMTTELMQHFHISAAGLGNLAAMFFYTYLITQLFVGPLLDRYNPRILTALAILISGCGMALFSHAADLTMAMLARGLVGVGAAFATVSYMKMTTLWFKPKHFAFVGGLLATASMLGSIAGQAPLAILVAHSGWQTSLYYCGLAGIVFALLYFVCVKNQPNHTVAPKSAKSAQRFMSILRNKANWYLMIYSGLAFSPLAVFGGLWGNPFLQVQYHLSNTASAYQLTFLFLGLAIGAPCLGYIAERFLCHFRIMFAGLLLSAVAIVLLVYCPSVSHHQLALPLFLFGFGTGAFMLGFTLGKKHNPLPLAATVIALINTGDALLGAVTEPLVGKALDYFWSGNWQNNIHAFATHEYHLALSILPVYLLVAVFFLWRYQLCIKQVENKLT